MRPYDDEKLGFYKVAKYYYYPGWWEPGPNLSYYVGQKAWASLPTVYQEIFQAAAIESAVTMQARYDALNPGALSRLIEKGVQLRPFSDDIMAAAEEHSLAVLEENASKDATYAKVYAHWKKARTEHYRWWNTAERAYANFAFGRVG